MNVEVNIGDDKAKVSVVMLDHRWGFVSCFSGSTHLRYNKPHTSYCCALFQQQLVLNCVLRIS